jgi:hypothetical protein
MRIQQAELEVIVQKIHNRLFTDPDDEATCVADLREFLADHHVPLQRERKAIVRGTPIDQVRDYLPRNFQASVPGKNEVLIYGYDDHGWTLDGYVIPRLASGLIVAEEVV